METIKLELDEKKHGAFNLYVDDKKQGEMTLSIKPDVLTVYHTGVEPEAEGKGYAKKLLNEMTSYARANNLMVLPLCPYVHAQFKKNPEEYKDIWKK
ncbi:acetyltransferase [Flavobacterium sp. Leaf82]|jgi:predicted GNAT family acetyltransferase|uniref:GNAT family N-acetyltransferase n=1 Tax=unclassified Flavobacterium TaxID=196869 RepID=UPI0007007204|nr:GNAT family N-acetyltransferase [Flavobacterium sp. Leaf82]KQO28665.1 acetyltransferase [Flavobacterium sp. Leaf82]